MATPKVKEMSFLKKSILGFPILPITLEGSGGFSVENSTYTWEYSEDEERSKSQNSKKAKLINWKEIENTDNSVPLFTPEDQKYVGKVLRLTCIPINGRGNKSGKPFSAETETIEDPPIDTLSYIFRERVDRLSKKPDSQKFVRIVQYNVLAAYLTTETWFPASPKESLPIDYRLPILSLELRKYEPDIVTMQEVEDQYFDNYYQPYLFHECNLEGELFLKTDGKDGMAIFYNETKFELLESEKVVIREEMKKLEFYDDIKDPKVLKQLAPRPNVLAVSVLKPKGTTKSLIIIANTHLFSKPDGEHIRLLQTVTCTKFLEGKIVKLKKRYKDATPLVLFCGDLNCRPPYGAVRFLTTGKIERNDPDWTSKENGSVDPGKDITHSLELNNPHPVDILTNIVEKFEGCLDYTFCPKSSLLKLSKVYLPPTKTKMAKIMGVKENKVFLPNLYQPSDHLPLVADFNLQ